ncbi:MAG TPA: VWA domain-containing protein [Plasticicumulans sp.]|uniref:vWA domain-containing protein n=1 Tax=Plasticicumulans sp. TaxID=2307179 RepID=UPI002B7BDFD1|nr:VWA domain-containing protein [Plasticicumulans sp.]HNF66149.1 VWA domain-containing protein [Plasticicumulans sp.]HNG49717.1 VWA domain-containing protein [Plasticicumulans sp.]
MLTGFIEALRANGLPIGLGEYLTLLDGLRARVTGPSVEDFYFYARLALIKDERLYDRYDRVFADYFGGIEAVFPPDPEHPRLAIPAEWLRRLSELHLSDEERAQIEELGWDELMRRLIERLAEQRDAHHGGDHWIGTGGSSPYGHSGVNPAGVRLGGEGREGRAVKVWDRREYRNLDDTVELGTRNLKVALRKLRQFARSGAADTLDLDDTIESTARNAGWLDLKLVPERHNAVKVLLLLDVGGSMDWHVRICEELFSAARAEFKHLKHYYFHNCVYESVWIDNRRRRTERVPTAELLNTYGPDWRLVIVGDATMSPYEITQVNASVEHVNEEPGAVWLQRLFAAWPRAVWLNPQPEAAWEQTMSLRLIQRLARQRMYPLTLAGIDRAIRSLRSGEA